MRGAAGLIAIAFLGSCSDASQLISPAPALQLNSSHDGQPPVRIAEIHYDNASTDVGEAIEVSAPAGTDLTGWSIVLYNGSNGTVYDTDVLSGVVPVTCGARGVLVQNYPSNGIQNGAPDGVALVNAGGEVVEFLSYEGTFTAVGGPANGMTSVSIGVAEAGSEPAGQSLQRDGAGTWSGPIDATFGACNDEGDGEEPPPPPPPVTLPATRIVELHYDNASTDAGEAIEIEGPAGTDLAGWTLVLYNGGNSQTYHTTTFTQTIPATCDARGVIVVNYAVNGIQNGNPDGMALVDASGTVVEFLSYGGTITAVNGPAAGQTSVDIGVSESGSTPVGHSLQRDSLGVWAAPRPNTFGACNDAPVAPPPPPPPSSIVIHELMGDPANAESASWGEWFEVYNIGTVAVDLQGWTIASGGSEPAHVITGSVVVAPGGYAVLGRGGDPARNGGVALDYNYFTGSSTTIWLDAADWLVLRDAAGATVDSVRWTTLARGVTRALRNPALDNTNVDGANWGWSTTAFGAGDLGTPGAPNGTLSDTPPAVFTVSIGGRNVGDDGPLPVGFQDQLFATERDGTGTVVPTTFTWTSETPDLASVDPRGNVTALGAGTAILRATAADGRSGTFALPIIVAQPGAGTSYAGNTEFGVPTDADPADDFIIERPQYTLSYSGTRNTPNWVSYDLEATHFGSADRCNCFTPDPDLPASYARLLTTDYSGGGFDRGHLVPSADRTAGTLDNARTFYFSNIIPQTGDLNQGPWAALETYLRGLASDGTREVYVIAGVAGTLGTVKDEGLIAIPGASWKVAVILPRNQGLAAVDEYGDIELVAVLMPNVTGIRNVPWQSFETTVDAIEAASGYDLLALLDDYIERIVESGSEPPTARLDGPYTGSEGSAIAMSGAASTDPDGDALTFAWRFGDGSTGTGSTASHTYAQDGSYTVQLVVTDAAGLADTTTTSVSVANVAPAIEAFAGATLLPGETYSASGSFTDPGADAWSATVDYGDGSDEQPLALAGQGFSLSHVYAAAGTYTVRVSVSDDDETGTRTAEVLVQTYAEGVQHVIDMLEPMVAEGRIPRGTGTSLAAKLAAAQAQLEADRPTPAMNQLEAFLNELRALTGGKVNAAEAEVLAAEVARVLRALGS